MIQSVDREPRRSSDPRFRDDFRLELIRFRYLGYLSYKDLVLAGIVSGTGLIGFVGVLSMTGWTIIFLATLSMIALVLLTVGIGLMQCQSVTVVREGGLYIARDEKTDLVRHGQTAPEALRNLGTAVALHDNERSRKYSWDDQL